MTDPSASFRLDGKTAVVTGASSGLGTTFAESLAGAGANVVLAARRKERLDDLAERLRAGGANALPVACDVADESEVKALVSASLEAFGSVEVLVNNAGITDSSPAESEELAIFRRVVDVNLIGLFSCAQRFGRAMLEANGGSIINIASVLGLVGAGQIPQAAYTASKGAVVNMTRELAAQWARRGVRVNAIAPGWFSSEMTEGMFGDERALTWIRKRTPMGRAGQSHELSGALLYLASEASSYTTGQTITVDGGWTIV